MILMNYENQAKVFKALCDEKRLRILEILKEGDNCACVLVEELGIPQSSLSYHMKILCDSTIVQCRKEGKWTYYSLNEAGLKIARNIVDSILVSSSNSESGCTCQKEREMDIAH